MHTNRLFSAMFSIAKESRLWEDVCMQRKCRYCNQRGHNVRTCPEVNKDAASGMWSAQNRLDRNEATKSRLSRMERVCSYCKLSGHNVQTCPKKSQDNRDCVRNTREFRKRFIVACKEIKLGIGTIISHPNSGVGMVTGFVPGLIHMNTLSEDVRCMRVMFPTANKTFDVNLPKEVYDKMGQSYYSWKDYATIKSKTPTCMLPASLKDWQWEEVTDQKALLDTLGRK